MNYSKILVIFVIFTFTFNFLTAEISKIELNDSIKVKLKNTKKYKTHVLCFTEKGFVTCDNSNFIIEDIPKFASYHSYDELEYFQLKGKRSLLPIVITGGFIYLVTHSSVSSDPDRKDYEHFHANLFTALFTGLIFLISLAIPRNSKLDSTEDIEEFPSQFVVFSSEIPLVLQEFIDFYEK